MRRLFVASTSLFWLAVCGFWVAGVMLPVPPDLRAAPTERSYGLDEVAKHATDKDCWMAIGGQIYDLTKYLPQHPSDPAVLVQWCGKEATEAYRTKTKGRPHSPYADQLLPNYRIGVLSERKP